MRVARAVIVAMGLIVVVGLLARVVPRTIAAAPPGVRREWRAFVATIVGALTGEGSVVVVLGDSNTCGWGTGCEHSSFFWPSRRALPGGWRIDNAARPGMTAADRRACSNNGDLPCRVDVQCGSGNSCVAGTLSDQLPQSGSWRLQQIIAKYAPRRRHACVLASLGAAPQLVLALGTNDLLEAPGVKVGNRVLALYDRARAALPCFEVYVATVPPRRDADATTLQQANDTIRAGMEARGASAHVVRFDQQATGDLRPDGVHMNDAGEEHRAALAFSVLGW